MLFPKHLRSLPLSWVSEKNRLSEWVSVNNLCRLHTQHTQKPPRDPFLSARNCQSSEWTKPRATGSAWLFLVLWRHALTQCYTLFLDLFTPASTEASDLQSPFLWLSGGSSINWASGLSCFLFSSEPLPCFPLSLPIFRFLSLCVFSRLLLTSSYWILTLPSNMLCSLLNYS